MKSCWLLLLCLLYMLPVSAQRTEQRSGTLFQAGVASAFIGGLYDACYSYKELRRHGDFGLGAPDKLDGELVILDGKFYETRSSGKTFPAADTGSTSLAFINFFHADKKIVLPQAMSRTVLYRYLDSLLENPNGIYAIRIQGSFDTVRTRAFPPPEHPYRPLAGMLDQQHFFSFKHISGNLVGYRLPLYLEALSIHGYHFHFLSADKQSGGHIIDFIARGATVFIDELENYSLALPGSAEFRQFDFGKDRKEELKSVETGHNTNK
ncbi:acetolactate decarboxylase [Chitinophaga sp. Mgbs1]|uniref:Alpha-acetolactate decarboxylase n=1 Tax=Chitinophaga solisilvae TaxID=1233460 RepID=A0A433WKK2_9BACT|nr:acetolactate decarboxylase [Chitinophaga solisilvae]